MSGVMRAMWAAADRLLKTLPDEARYFAGHLESTGKSLNKSADIFEAAEWKQLVADGKFKERTQARLADGADENRPHWLLSEGDNAVVFTVHYKKHNLPQSGGLLKEFNKWLARTEGKDRVVRHEGRRPPEATNVKEAFRSERGEIAALIHIADKKGVESTPTEEDEGFQFSELLKNHRPEHVLGYYVLRQMPQGLAAKRNDPSFDMAAYLDQTLDRFAPYLPEGLDARQTFNDLMAREYAHTGFAGVFRIEDEGWLMRETNDPGVTGKAETPVQKVALECNERRDAHFVKEFQRDVDAGKAVFGQFGVIHVSGIAPNIDALANGSMKAVYKP
ncbi:hypothetical protein ACFWPH_21425 [Nocardia sp. NPDC058499]|uniref:hypothetical protein n=1 Tax=Nocardia sp. NPDC058499 TaxID=3346530 RepID=UPI0036554BDF